MRRRGCTTRARSPGALMRIATTLARWPGLHLGDSTWSQRPRRTCFVVHQDVVTDAQRVPLEPVHVRAPEAQPPIPNKGSELTDQSSLARISGGGGVHS